MAAQVPTLAGITREAVPWHPCSNTHSSPYLEGRGFTVVRCDVCGLFYVNPQPSAQELAQLCLLCATRRSFSTRIAGRTWPRS